MKAGKYLSVFICVFFMAALLSGCNSASVTSGIVTQKMYGTPTSVAFGPISITLLSSSDYCLLVTDAEGKSQWFVVSEAEYKATSIGMEFIYNRKKHRAL